MPQLCTLREDGVKYTERVGPCPVLSPSTTTSHLGLPDTLVEAWVAKPCLSAADQRGQSKRLEVQLMADHGCQTRDVSLSNMSSAEFVLSLHKIDYNNNKDTINPNDIWNRARWSSVKVLYISLTHLSPLQSICFNHSCLCVRLRMNSVNQAHNSVPIAQLKAHWHQFQRERHIFLFCCSKNN